MMFKFLIIISFIAIVLLLSVTIILVKFNYSDKLLSPIFSIILIGTVTTFITVLLMLKESSIEKSITTFIVINAQNNLPPLLGPSASPSEEFNKRQSEYVFLTSWQYLDKDKMIKVFDPPLSNDEIIPFYQEMLQYSIFKEIIKLQYTQTPIQVTLGPSGVTSSIKTPFKLSEKDEMPLTDFYKQISSNRFSKGFLEKDTFFPIYHSRLPKDTKIEFRKTTSSTYKTTTNYEVVLSKSNFFKIEIIIEPRSFTAPNMLPSNLKLPDETRNNCKTYIFTIIMHAKFEKISSGNWRTQEYKDWVTWLFNELSIKYSDDDYN